MSVKMDDRGILVQCGQCGTKNRLPFSALEKQIRCGQCKSELPRLNAPVEIASAQQFRSITGSSSVPVLVDFWAEWCGPCKMLAPELEKVAASAAGEAVIAKLNTEAVPQIASAFGISSIPNLVLFRGGREAGRIAGARPASEILRFLRNGG